MSVSREVNPGSSGAGYHPREKQAEPQQLHTLFSIAGP